LFGGAKRARLQRAEYEQACAIADAQEQRRVAQLADAERRHTAAEADRLRAAAERNAEVDRLEEGLRTRDPRAVEDYFEMVLAASPLPEGIPIEVEAAYQADARRLLVVQELPASDVIPGVQSCRYVRTRDEIDAKPRPLKVTMSWRLDSTRPCS
jgi:restriction system protein